MSRTPIGIAMNGVTGRMGYRQHLLRSILAIREQGGCQLADGTVLWPEPLLVGRSEDKLRAIAERHGLTRWTTSLEKALAERRHRDLLRRPADQRARASGDRRDRRRKAHLRRKAHRDQPRRRRAPGPPRRHARCAHRRRRGQAVPARPAETAQAGRRGVLRQGALGGHRVRVLGVRRGLATRAAAVLELPGRGRRRHHQRHVPALALRAGGHRRAAPLRLRDRRDRHPATVRRAGRAVRRRPPRTSATRSSNSMAAYSPPSGPPGRPG